jgi:hypothetical protein
VTSPHTGKVWLDRNLGASQVCTSATDSQCYGDYFYPNKDANGIPANWSATDGSSVCPVDFRVATAAELQAELTGGNITETNSAFNSFLKLSLAGFLHNGSLYQQGDYGYLWLKETSVTLFLHSTFAGIQTRDPIYGFPLRCIKN